MVSFSFMASLLGPEAPDTSGAGGWVRREDSSKKLQVLMGQRCPWSQHGNSSEASLGLWAGLLGGGCHLAASVSMACRGTERRQGRPVPPQNSLLMQG